MSPPPPFRLARAAIFAVVCVALTVAAHTAVSHREVPLLAAGAGGLLVLGVAWALAGHERAPITILGGLLGGQFALHTMFAAAQPTVNTTVHLGHGQPGPLPIAPSGAGMTLTHVLVAVACAWWLRHGERTAWSMARRVAALATVSLAWALFDAAPPVRPVVVPPAVRTRPRPIAVVLRHSVVLRGPPSGSWVLGCG